MLCGKLPNIASTPYEIEPMTEHIHTPTHVSVIIFRKIHTVRTMFGCTATPCSEHISMLLKCIQFRGVRMCV